jgi:hypothetical protein
VTIDNPSCPWCNGSGKVDFFDSMACRFSRLPCGCCGGTGKGRPPKLQSLIERLANIQRDAAGDPESAHQLADDALLDYIGDGDVRTMFKGVAKWYA